MSTRLHPDPFPLSWLGSKVQLLFRRWPLSTQLLCLCLEYITHFWLFTTTAQARLCQQPGSQAAATTNCRRPAVRASCKMLCHPHPGGPGPTLLFRQANPDKSWLKLHSVSGLQRHRTCKKPYHTYLQHSAAGSAQVEFYGKLNLVSVFITICTFEIWAAKYVLENNDWTSAVCKLNEGGNRWDLSRIYFPISSAVIQALTFKQHKPMSKRPRNPDVIHLIWLTYCRAIKNKFR